MNLKISRASSLIFSVLFLVAGAAKAEQSPILNGRLTGSQVKSVQRFLGTFSVTPNAAFSRAEGSLRVSLASGERLVMSSNLDLSGENCGVSAGPALSLQTFADATDVTFALNRGHCPWIEGSVITLHYNRALTGADIYEVEILMDSEAPGPHGTSETMQTWVLEKR